MLIIIIIIIIIIKGAILTGQTRLNVTTSCHHDDMNIVKLQSLYSVLV